MKFKITNITVKDINDNSFDYVIETTNKEYQKITIHLASEDKTNKRKIFDIISIDKFPGAKYCIWDLKELEII